LNTVKILKSKKPAIQIEDLPCVKELSDAEAQQVAGGATKNSWFETMTRTLSRIPDKINRKLDQTLDQIDQVDRSSRY
jgi:hypothetical protein